MEETGAVCYVLRDRQGSKRVVTTGSGGVMARHDYMAYGEEVPATIGMRDASTQKYGVPDNARQRFAQTEDDKAAGLEHAKWRKMESDAGRWTSPDPYRTSMRKGNPQSMNRYAYTQNDPVNAVDPSGLEMIDAGYYGVEEVIQVNVYASRFTPFYHYDAIGMNIGDNFGMIFDGRPVPEFAEPQKPDCERVSPVPSDVDVDANIAEAIRQRERALTPSPYPDAGEDPLARMAGLALWFYNQVNYSGQWDYKTTRGSEYIAFGNFNYGATGAALGFSEDVLRRLAGWAHQREKQSPGDGGDQGNLAQVAVNILLGRDVFGESPYGDELEDQNNIIRGINYHRGKYQREDCK